MANAPEFPRRFKEHSNQHVAEGWCHGLGVTHDGRPFALLEYQGGGVSVRYLDDVYHIELSERSS